MTGNGRLFGMAGGSLVSLLGSLAGGLVAFLLGRSGKAMLDRRIASAERARAEAFLNRWGLMALVLSRPLPVLAESVAVVAAAMGMPPGRFALGILAGTLPLALLYAAAGAWAQGWASGFLVFAVVIAISGLFWRYGQRTGKSS